MTVNLVKRCAHCHQPRPLFTYKPDHTMHLGGYGFDCRWCNVRTQPRLCVPCWSAERLVEEDDTALNYEGELWASILGANDRYIKARSS